MSPYLGLYTSKMPGMENQAFDVWVVFDLHPGEKRSYVIAYDEDGPPDHPFVLAVWNQDQSGLTYIHHSSTFWETLEGM